MALTKTIEGWFNSSATNKFIPLPFTPVKFQWWNKTKFDSASTSPHYMTEGVAFSEDSAGVAYGKISNTTAIDINVILDANSGLSFVTAGSYQYGPTLTISGITQAADASITTTTNHNLSVGDAVLIYGTTSMLQIAGVVYSVKAVSSATVFTIEVDSSAFAAAATAGFCKKLLYPDLYIPEGVGIIGVTAANPGVVTTAVNHSFVVGQEVFFVFPQSNTGLATFGMNQLDSATYLQNNGVPQRAIITAVTSNTFTINIDTSGFAAFAYPTSAQYALGITPPMVFGIGDQNTGFSINSSGNVPFLGTAGGTIGIPGSFTANTRQGVILPTAATYSAGSAVTLHTTSDKIHWEATYPDGFNQNM